MRIHEIDVTNLYRMFLKRGNRFEVRDYCVWLIAGEPLFNPPPCIVGAGWGSVLFPYVVKRR